MKTKGNFSRVKMEKQNKLKDRKKEQFIRSFPQLKTKLNIGLVILRWMVLSLR